MAITFERCRADQIDALRTFFSQQYSADYILARDRDFLRWQFGAAPGNGGDGLDVNLAVVDGQIAGCIGYVPVSMSLDGRLVPAAWALNWMVDDRHRKLGLGPLLMRELCRQFEVTLALGGNRDAHALLPRMGWTDYGDLKRFVAVLDAGTAGRLTESGRLPGAARVADGESNGVERIDRFDDQAGRLWDALNTQIAGTRRTSPFLNWRYADHPVFQYRLFQSRHDEDSLGGFAVYRIEQVQDVARIGRIVELVGTQTHTAALLKAIVADARDAGVAMLDFFDAGDRRGSMLADQGFMSGSEPPACSLPMLFQPIDRSRSGVLFMAHMKSHRPDDWYVTTADGDQDRPN